MFTNLKPSGRGGLGFLLFFTIFWCSITGVFVGMVARSFWRAGDAQRRYVRTTGTVLSSEVTQHYNEGTTYGFGIRYRYTVSGRTFESDRYAFGQGNSSDGRRNAEQLVRRHPAGSPVTVYYDPAQPAEAVISRTVEPTMYFLLLFLQPFILVGVGMLGAVVFWPWRGRRVRRFSEQPPDPPWRIPTWGVLERTFEGLVVQPRRSPGELFMAAALGYGLACFVSIFVIGFGFGGFSGKHPSAILVAFLVAFLTGAGSAVGSLRATRRKARFALDPASQRVHLTSPLREVTVPFAEIAGWNVKQIFNPRNVKQEGQSPFVPLLTLRTTAGQEVPIHVFGADAAAPAIAAKVAEVFAAWTHQPVAEEPPPGGDDPVAVLSASRLLAAAREVQTAARQLRDLC